MGRVVPPAVYSPFRREVFPVQPVIPAVPPSFSRQISASPTLPAQFGKIQPMHAVAGSQKARGLVAPPRFLLQRVARTTPPRAFMSTSIQRAEDPAWQNLVKPGSSFGGRIVYVSGESEEYDTKVENLFANEELQRKPRSFSGQHRQQVLRWFATFLLNKYGGREIQCYEDTDGAIYVSSNTNEVNKHMRAVQGSLFPSFTGPKSPVPQERVARHKWKTSRAVLVPKSDEDRLKTRIASHGVVVIPEDDTLIAGYHAERRIQKYLGKNLDPSRLAGAKRACMVCAVALGLPETSHPGILYTSKAGLGGLSEHDVKKTAEAKKYRSHVTVNRQGYLIDTYGSDSEDDSY